MCNEPLCIECRTRKPQIAGLWCTKCYTLKVNEGKVCADGDCQRPVVQGEQFCVDHLGFYAPDVADQLLNSEYHYDPASR